MFFEKKAFSDAVSDFEVVPSSSPSSAIQTEVASSTESLLLGLSCMPVFTQPGGASLDKNLVFPAP